MKKEKKITKREKKITKELFLKNRNITNVLKTGWFPKEIIRKNNNDRNVNFFQHGYGMKST